METSTVEIFLSCRPEYSRDHGASIAQSMREEGVPFCFICADWHEPGTEHSES